MDMFSTTVISAVVAAVVGPFVSEWLRWRRDKSSEKLDALKASVLLEGYALECASKVAEHQTFKSSKGLGGSLLGSTPDFPKINVVASFLKPKKLHLADQVAFFPQEVEQVRQEIAFWWNEYHDKESTGASRETACLGLKALDLANRMRQAFRLPERELKMGAQCIRVLLEEEAKECQRAN